MNTSKSRQLAVYLTGTAGAAALLSAPQAEAAVTAVTFGFGSVLNTSSGVSYYSPTTPNNGEMTFWGQSNPYAFQVRIGDSRPGFGRFYQQGLPGYSGPSFPIGLATFLSNGTVVGGGGNGTLGTAYFGSSQQDRNFASNEIGKNLGFVTSTGNWGWANVDWDASARQLTINSAYVESVAGNTITVGDTGISAAPEPSRALLALAGLAGVALRRRRKQAA